MGAEFAFTRFDESERLREVRQRPSILHLVSKEPPALGWQKSAGLAADLTLVWRAASDGGNWSHYESAWVSGPNNSV